MSKILYLFIALILSVTFWDLIFFDTIFNTKTSPFIAIIWALFGLYWFRSKAGNIKIYNFKKYYKYFYWLIIGFLLSTIPAFLFWKQNFDISLIAYRRLIFYIFLPMILYMQPSEKQIIKALLYYTIVYIIISVTQAFTPFPILTSVIDKITLGRGSFDFKDNFLGYLLPGVSMVLFFFYYKLQQFKELPNSKSFITVFILFCFILVLQNRGALFFATLIFIYVLFKQMGPNKIFSFLVFCIIAIVVFNIFSKYWNSMVNETLIQFNDPDYNRWKAYRYFVFEYSPNWLCTILGNGFLSAKTQSGQFLQSMMNEGYYQSDIGLIGFWSMYGIIPIIVIYSIILNILFHKKYPFYLKAISAHILFVPISWGFDSCDIMILVIIIYIYAYYVEKNKMICIEKFKSIYSSSLKIVHKM